MIKQFTFRGMEHSATIEEYARNQFEKIERFLSHEKEPQYIHMIFTAGFTHHHHRVELQVTTPNYELIAHREGPEFYDLVSQVFDIMYHQLTEAKRKMIDERHTGIKRE
jgi:ribosomal subunit interface protein